MKTMKTYETSDIAISAYLAMRGLTLLVAQKVGNKFRFIFEDADAMAEIYEREYLSSDFPRYDASMRQVKRRLYKG
jgi:hypothetical protein